jgi:kinesin family protein 2/24
MMGSNIKKINNDNLYIPGFYVLASYDIFSFLKEKEFSNLTIYISFYEIYCSKLYDLLNNRNLLQIREDAKQNINIIGLTEKEVNDFDSLINLIQYGLKIRTIGITGLNNNSSRSHGIIEIKLMNKIKNKVHGKISFIDLAGSEREQDKININKKTRIDGAEINKSLLTLKECIRAMENNQKYFPFRGSKLTLVLRDSFIGNCKTLMIANISPSSFNADHTLNTLRYAYRVKELKKENKNKNYSKAKSDKKSACFNKDFIGGLLNKEKNKKIV